jgi:hypothetical protein
MTLGGHQSDKLTDEDISHQSTLNCHQSTPKLTVAEADDRHLIRTTAVTRQQNAASRQLQ